MHQPQTKHPRQGEEDLPQKDAFRPIRTVSRKLTTPATPQRWVPCRTRPVPAGFARSGSGTRTRTGLGRQRCTELKKRKVA